jgi:hypothetical protein
MVLACAVFYAVALGRSSPTAQRSAHVTQTTGAVSVSGRITDPNGSPASDARVELTEKSKGTVWTTQTNESGWYAIRLPPGRYDVVVASPGFKEFKIPDVVVDTSESKTVDVPLKFGNVAETITVTSSEDEPATTELTWNVWAEPAATSPSFNYVSFLEPNKDYMLVIDLGALAYGHGKGLYTQNAAARLRDWLLESKVNAAELKLLVIPDDTYFKPLAPSGRVSKLPVDLQHVRKALKDGVKVNRDPFEALRDKPDADFSFGRVMVNIRTRAREGTGAVAVAVWADGSVPVDELSIPLCVAKDEAAAAAACESGATLRDSLAGIDPLRAAAQGRAYGMRPDAALHFLQLGDGKAVGIFRDNSWEPDRYVQWNLETDASGVMTALRSTLLRDFDLADDDASLLQVGADLYKLLFPSSDDDEAGDKARAAFADFLRAHAKDNDPSDPPSIFVRVLSKTEDPPFLIPLGLMAYEIDGQQDFLGFHYRIQMPLPVQDYRSDERCISNWVVLAPRSNVAGVPPELNDARNGFSDWFTKWRLKEIDDISEFGRWVGTTEREQEPVALFLLAHHDANSLYFAETPRVRSITIDRRFKMPSVAVVNGCGTGAPGASGVVERLNARGVTSIIATSVKVDGYLAGDFFSVLGQTLAEDHKGRKYPLGLAHFQALRKLRTKTSRDPERPTAYGAKVLAYQLLGNSDLQVCPPPTKK